MVMPTAQILKDRTTAAVRKVIREMEINVMVSYNHTACLQAWNVFLWVQIFRV